MTAESSAKAFRRAEPPEFARVEPAEGPQRLGTQYFQKYSALGKKTTQRAGRLK
jgi:hypothetical protein